MARETSPCSAETALACRESFSPITVMQNSSFIVGRVFAAQSHQPVMINSKLLAQGTEVILDQPGIEAIVAGGHRRVRREDDFRRYARHGVVKPDPLFLHPIANRLEDGEGAVSFVQMKNARRDAHCRQRAETADSQQHLLPDAQAGVAAVQARRKLAVLGGIAFDVGIEQEQIATPDFQAPDDRANCAVAHLDLNADWLALGPDGRFERQPADFGREVRFLLPAIRIEVLSKISLPVE